MKTKANPTIKLDVKGDGGFCVLPPSRHKSGRLYQMVLDAEPADLPEGLLEFIDKEAADGDNRRAEGRAQDRTRSEGANGQDSGRSGFWPISCAH